MVVVGLADTAGLVRVMQGNLSDILSMRYSRPPGQGPARRVVIYKHAVRNAHPLIMNLGMSRLAFISGSTVVSIVLSLPTCGPLYFNALRSQDMFLWHLPCVHGHHAGNRQLLGDIALALVDPRIRYE